MALAGIVLAAGLSLGGSGLPQGWRMATHADVAAPDRRAAPMRQVLVARADFDGDGREDRAVVLINDKAKSFALYVLRARRPALRLTEDEGVGALWGAGLQIARAGRYGNLCDAGAGPDAGPCVAKLEARYPAIVLHTDDGVRQIFAWDGRTFRRQWLND